MPKIVTVTKTKKVSNNYQNLSLTLIFIVMKFLIKMKYMEIVMIKRKNMKKRKLKNSFHSRLLQMVKNKKYLWLSYVSLKLILFNRI